MIEDNVPLRPGTRVRVRDDAYSGGAAMHGGRLGTVIAHDFTPDLVWVRYDADGKRRPSGLPGPWDVQHPRRALVVLSSPVVEGQQ